MPLKQTEGRNDERQLCDGLTVHLMVALSSLKICHQLHVTSSIVELTSNFSTIKVHDYKDHIHLLSPLYLQPLVHIFYSADIQMLVLSFQNTEILVMHEENMNEITLMFVKIYL